jgi:O-methyltransferase involved in polyketide biosynthesis
MSETDERRGDPRPDSSAVRTALWRALHVELDDPPHLIDDEIGLALAAPDEGWRDRGDMHPLGTRSFRAAIVARTRFVEDLVVDEGIGQYVLLGAGHAVGQLLRP